MRTESDKIIIALLDNLINAVRNEPADEVISSMAKLFIAREDQIKVEKTLKELGLEAGSSL